MPRRIMQSYEMIPKRFKEKYFEFYKELYDPERSVIDIKTKELIAIAASLASGCKGCFKGHVQKAVKYGASREEVGEAIAIAVAINAAAIVDQTDIANFEEDLVAELWGDMAEEDDSQAENGALPEDISP